MMNVNLNELALENLGQWPKIVKISAIGLVFLIIVSLGYWLFVKAIFEQYDALKAEEATLRVTFELKQRQASNLDAYRNQMLLMEERFGDMLKQLPTQNEMPGLLEDISKTGIASGLTFTLFAPMPEVPHDFYIELPIKIVVTGNYQQFAVFLSRIGQMSRIITLHDFVLEGVKTESKTNNPDGLLSMQLTAKIYRYRTR